jgi:hypothetical protein
MLRLCLPLCFLLFSLQAGAAEPTPQETLNKKELAWLADHPVIRLGIDPLSSLNDILNYDNTALYRAKENELTFLEIRGCNSFQGFYFSKPLPAAEFVALAAGNTPLEFPA